MDNTPLIAVVTVVRNGASTIAYTLESVCQQDYPAIEFVVIDGVSTDGTLEIVEKYRDRISVFISEPDKGIYDAMQKGVAFSKGAHLLFLNADDAFTDPGALARLAAVRNALPADQATICYADYLKFYPALGKSLLFSTSESFERGMTICQQTMLADRNIFDRIGSFDTSFRLSADLDWVIRAKRAGVTLVKAEIPPVAVIRGGGASDTQYKVSRAEGRRIVLQYYGFKAYLLFVLRQYWVTSLRALAKWVTPLIGQRNITRLQTAYLLMVRGQQAAGPGS